MNLDMSRPRNETEDLLLSITNKRETLIKQTHTKPQKHLILSLPNPKKPYHLNHLIILVLTLYG